jgi:hypothetical protein
MKNLFKALANFQYEVPVIHKGTKGYGYSYADLPTIFDVINPLLKKHGLGFTQLLNTKEGVTYISTNIFHIESGENIESNVEIPSVQLAKMNDYQAFGSGVTYYRRYALSSALCLVTDKDLDGSGEQIKKKESKPTLSVTQFNNLVGSIMSGKESKTGEIYTPELATKLYTLNEDQIKTLKTLEI